MPVWAQSTTWWVMKVKDRDSCSRSCYEVRESSHCREPRWTKPTGKHIFFLQISTGVVINKLDNFKCSGGCGYFLLSAFSLSRDTFNQESIWVFYKMLYIKKEPQSHKDETVFIRSLKLTPCIIQCHIILGLLQALRLLVSSYVYKI